MCQSKTASAVRTGRRVLLALFALAVFTASAQAQYLFSTQQSAWILKPKQVEVAPDFATVSIHSGGESMRVWNIYGVDLGVGLIKNVELRVRYGYLDPKYGSGVSLVNFGPKIGLWKNIIALCIPFEFAFGDVVDVSETWSVHPTLLASIPVGKGFEITPSAKALIPFQRGADTLVALNLGLGVFALTDKNLVIRPEVGIEFQPGQSGSFLQVSIGIGYHTKPKG